MQHSEVPHVRSCCQLNAMKSEKKMTHTNQNLRGIGAIVPKSDYFLECSAAFPEVKWQCLKSIFIPVASA